MQLKRDNHKLSWTETSYGDFWWFQKLEQSFEGTQRRRLDVNTAILQLDPAHGRFEFVGHFFLANFLFIGMISHQKIQSSDGLLQLFGRDLDTLSRTHFLRLRVRVLHPQLFHGLWQQQGSNRRHDGTVCPGQDDRLSFVQRPVHQDNVDRRTCNDRTISLTSPITRKFWF